MRFVITLTGPDGSTETFGTWKDADKVFALADQLRNLLTTEDAKWLLESLRTMCNAYDETVEALEVIAVSTKMYCQCESTPSYDIEVGCEHEPSPHIIAQRALAAIGKQMST
jgi:hypothetical protein